MKPTAYAGRGTIGASAHGWNADALLPIDTPESGTLGLCVAPSGDPNNPAIPPTDVPASCAFAFLAWLTSRTHRPSPTLIRATLERYMERHETTEVKKE